jgi:flagellar hook-associated protein 2
MSDLTIPGVTSKVDTAKMIDALMEPKRAQLEKKKEQVQSLKDQKKIWQDLREDISRLQESSKELYGFKNPFNEKLAVSSDETILRATVSREADFGERKITVKKVARGDKFVSRSLSKKFRVAPGVYRFRVGEKEVKFSFKGGSLMEFAEAISKKSGGLIKATVVNDTADTQVIIIESTKTGDSAKLIFEEQALEFGFQSGMLEAVHGTKLDVPIDQASAALWETPEKPDSYRIADGKLTLKANSEGIKIPIVPSFSVIPEMVLEFDIDVKIFEETAWTPPPLPPGPEVSTPGAAEFQGVTVENERSQYVKPELERPKPTEAVEDLRIVSLVSGERTLELPQISHSAGTQKFRVSIGEMTDRLDALLLVNRNTHREITISSIRIYDPTTRGDHRPVHALSEAQDALLIMDGVEVYRETNLIDDLIPGVTLELIGESEDPVTLNVETDEKAIKEKIIEFVGHYNRLLTQIDILTRNDSAIIEEALYLTEEEQQKAARNLGLLQGELGLSQLKNRLRTIMLSPYKTRVGRDLTLLAQIGISTDASKLGTSATLERSKLRGYLEIDEEKLEAAFNRFPEAIRELFGYDTDGDFIVDSGVAYSIDSNMRYYVSSTGYIANRVATIDRTVQNRNRDIADYEKYLADYELGLKKKYGRMEHMLRVMEQNSQTIENFNKRGEK